MLEVVLSRIVIAGLENRTPEPWPSLVTLSESRSNPREAMEDKREKENTMNECVYPLQKRKTLEATVKEPVSTEGEGKDKIRRPKHLESRCMMLWHNCIEP